MPFVLHIDTGNEWRGGQKQVALLARGMRSKGWKIALACPLDSPLWNEVSQDNFIMIPIPKGWSLKTPMRLRTVGADLIAAHTSHAHGCAAVLSTPLVVHRRVDFIPSGGWKYRRPDAYIAVSQAVANILQNVGAHRVFVVHDGVDPLPVMPPSPDSPDILCVGACVAHKGHRYLAEAAKRLPGVDIAVAGEGPLKYPGLRYLGFRNDIPSLFAGSKALVHPSIEEGMGQVVVEAMAAGLPVVVTDAGGLPEVVVDQCGFVVPKANPEALAVAIKQTLDGEGYDPMIAKKRAEACFSANSMIDKTCQAYLDVLSMTT